MNFLKTKTGIVVVHLLMATLLAVLILVQQGKTDYKVLIVAAIVAAMGFMEKTDGPWKTTMGGSLTAVLYTALPMLQQNQHPSWTNIFVSLAIVVLTYLSGDRTITPALTQGNVGTGANSSPPQPEPSPGTISTSIPGK